MLKDTKGAPSSTQWNARGGHGASRSQG